MTLEEEILFLAGCELPNKKSNLFEGSVMGLKKQFPKLPENIWEIICKIDPECNSDQSGKISRWLAQLIMNDARNVPPEELNNLTSKYNWEQIKEAIDKLANVPNGLKKVVTTCKSFQDLFNLANQDVAPISKELQLVKKSLSLGSKVIYESNRYIAFIPWTLASSKVMRGGEGSNTVCVWCTAWENNNRWEHYMNPRHPLKIIFDKKENKLYQYQGSKDEWAGFRDQHNKSLPMESAIDDGNLISILKDDSNYEEYAEQAQETLNKFGNNLTDDEFRVLNRYINPDEVDGDDEATLALADELGISYTEAAELIENGNYLVLTDAEAENRAREMARDNIEDVIGDYKRGYINDGWWKDFLDNWIPDCIESSFIDDYRSDYVAIETENIMGMDSSDMLDRVEEYNISLSELISADKVEEMYNQLVENDDMDPIDEPDFSNDIDIRRVLEFYIDANGIDEIDNGKFESNLTGEIELAIRNEIDSMDDVEVVKLLEDYGYEIIQSAVDKGYIDYDELARHYVDEVGRDNCLSAFDGEELVNSSQSETYYIYRM